MVTPVFLLICGDTLLSVLALYCATLLRYGQGEVADMLQYASTPWIISIFIAGTLFSSYLMDTYDLDRITKSREIFINVIFATLTSFFVFSVVYYLGPDIKLGRGVLFLSLAFFAMLQSCWHTIFFTRRLLPRFDRRILILGSGELAEKIGALITSGKHNVALAGYATCSSNGHIQMHDDEAVSSPKCDEPAPEELISLLKYLKADTLVVALAERRGVFPLKDVLRCKMNGITIMDAPACYEFLQGKLLLEHITPSWFIFSNGFQQTRLLNFCKRCVDVVLSLTGLLIALPLLPLIALAITLDSPGPVLFRQIRMGKDEQLFTLYKFRSMRADAEAANGAVWATKNDTRVTKLGKFLRNTRLDEIPQLYNVLIGDMSFVGPRPERPEFIDKLKQVIPYYSKRHFIKPGLTGWAQVRYPYGASVEDAIEKLRYDLYYTKNMSPFLDSLIILETVKVVLFGRGAQ